MTHAGTTHESPDSSSPSSSPRRARAHGMSAGFTLIELLLVIGIIAVLSGMVIAALSPTRQLGSARDAKRQSDVNTILNAVYQYSIDNQGRLPAGIPLGDPLEICRTGAASCVNGVDLEVLSGAYLVTVPLDPRAPEAGTGTNYFISRAEDGRLSVEALLVEGADPIIATR